MSNKYLKRLFEVVKGAGGFENYSSYEDYRQKNWGQAENKREKFLEWLESLNEKEKVDFNYIFGED